MPNKYTDALNLAKSIAGDRFFTCDREDAIILAHYLLCFDRDIKEGKIALPSEWEPYAMHLAGYDKP